MFHDLYRVEVSGLAVGRVERDQDFTADLGFYRNEYQIQYVVNGERYFFYEGICTKLEKGTMALIDKELIPKTCLIGGAYHDRILVEMQEERFAPLFQGLGMDLRSFFREHHGVYRVPESGPAFEGFRRIDELARQEGKDREARMKLEVLSLLAGCASWEQERCPDLSVGFAKAAALKQKRVHEVADYITEHYSQDCSVESLSRRFYMSKSYLCRVFREVTNFTISEYVNLYRIAASKTYLLDESYSITVIAQLLGYDSLTYFERVFKKQMSITPQQFRKKYRGSSEGVRYI